MIEIMDDRYHLNSSFFKILWNFIFKPKYINVKLVPAKSINITIIASIQGFWKAAILACLVENPPVEVVVKEWLIASKKSSPKNKIRWNFK